MTSNKRIFFAVVFAIVVALAFYSVFVPTKVSRENSVKVAGIVTRVGKDHLNNIYITLDGHQGSFVINSGITRGFSPDSLRARLIGKKAEILYLKPYWLSGFTPSMSPTRYITEIRESNEVIHSEMR